MYKPLKLNQKHIAFLDVLDRANIIYSTNRSGGPWYIAGAKPKRINAALVGALVDAGYMERFTVDALGTPEYRVRVNRAGAAMVEASRRGIYDEAEDYLKHQVLYDLTKHEEDLIYAWAEAEGGVSTAHGVCIPDGTWQHFLGLGLFVLHVAGVKGCDPVTHGLSERGRWIASELRRMREPKAAPFVWGVLA